jgi:alkylation response protein AidB-like acyl-CoA dehydrogenase
MDLSYSAEYERFREQVRAFLAASWPPKGDEAKLDIFEQTARFRERSIEAGFMARSIPKRYGGAERAPDVLEATIIGEEFRKAGAPGEARGIGAQMLVPTLLEHGTEAQKERFIPATMRGDVTWCQGYSEPGSGSDLASLQTRAVLEGDEWVINGQKIWTTGAQVADWMFALCRTEPEHPRHAGISYIVLDMKTQGIDVRPLRTMTGIAEFNEVFFDDVRVPAENIVGRRGEGWIVSRSTLKHERNMIGGFEGVLANYRGLVDLAKNVKRNGVPAIEDSHVRQQLIEIEGYVEAHRYSGYRQLTCAARRTEPGITGMMNKLNSTNLGHRFSNLAQDLMGDAGMVSPTDGDFFGQSQLGTQGWARQYMWSLGIAIAGGTANIQRNVIAERGLGLPRDRAANRS